MRCRRLLHMRQALLLVGVLGFAVTPFPTGPASASCPAPYLNTEERMVLERGATVVVEGRAFVDGCQDSVTCTAGLGCDSCEADDPPPEPMDDVRLQLVQGERHWSLDVADAEKAGNNHLGWVTWSFDLPVAIKPGRATLVAEHAEPVRARIR
jgi:hypothetical protein